MTRVPIFYRVLLRLFPTKFRHEFGTDMERFFADRLQEARSSGRPGALLSECGHAVIDTVRNATGERVANLRGPRSSLDDRRRSRSVVANLIGDVRLAVRLLLKKPAFASAAILTLGLGIGTSTMIFSLVDAVLLRPLPYPQSDRLVGVFRIDPDLTGSNPTAGRLADFYAIPYAVYLDWIDMSSVFVSGGAYHTTVPTLTGDDRPERVAGGMVTSGVFAALGVRPMLGRTFLPADDEVGAPGLAILGHGLWQSRFGSDSAVVGRQIMVNGVSHVVVGVMPPEFGFPDRTSLWTTFDDERKTEPMRHAGYLQVIARIRSGVSLEQAQHEVDAVARRIGETHPDEVEHGIGLFPYKDLVVSDMRAPLLLLLGAVGVVLLIACANIANLLLVRAAERRREIGVRQALGARRRRLVTQHLNESVVLSLAGGALGYVIAVVSRGPFIAAFPGGLPGSVSIEADYRVFAIAAAFSLLSGLLAGALPALRASRTSIVDVLQEGSRGFAGGKQRNRTNAALVVSEIALAFVLLAVAGSLVRSYARLTSVDPGFVADGVFVMPVSLPDQYRGAENAGQAFALFQQLGDQLAAIPGVAAVGEAGQMPFMGGNSWPPTSVETSDGVSEDNIHSTSATPSYFTAMSIPTVAGRALNADDRWGSVPVVVVSETMARRYWPGEDPIGRRVRLDMPGDSIWRTVVGVMGDVRYRQNSQPFAQFYIPFSQDVSWYAHVVIKTTIAREAVLPAIREALWAVNPDIPARVYELENRINRSTAVAGPRFGIFILGSLSALAALLAVLGVYGVLAYTVEQRAHEIGIRMALGAGTGNVLGGVLRRGAVMAATGVGIGLVIALALSRVLNSVLFEVSATDPVTLSAVGLLVAGAALLASYIPARRATRVDPVEALRQE